MSFGTNLTTIMQNDASLSGYLTGGIYFENLPDSYDLSKNWLVYSFRKSSQNDCLSQKNVYQTYDITAKIVATDTVMLETISDYLVDYLNGKTEGNIQDTWFVSDNHTIDLEKSVYMNSIDFQSFYA